MTDSNQNRVSLPEPCHEDWGQMSPAAEGRFCQVCTKVVVDFTQSNLPEINGALQKSESQVCGRFHPTQVKGKPLQVHLFQRYPVARMRNFLLAFVTAFGWGVWALGQQGVAAALPAQVVLATQVEQGDSVKVNGKVLSEIDGSGLAYVTLVVKVDGEIIAGTLSDSTGVFALQFSLDRVPEEGYELVVSYLGRERVEMGLQKDVEEIVMLVDDSFVLDEVQLYVQRELVDTYTNTYTGIVTGVVEPSNSEATQLVGRFVTGMKGFELRYYYPPMNDWLMMRNSEVNQTGRW